MTLLEAEDAALRGEDLPHEVAMVLLRKALNARNHFARRVGELRAQLPVTPGDYPMPFNDYMAPVGPLTARVADLEPFKRMLARMEQKR